MSNVKQNKLGGRINRLFSFVIAFILSVNIFASDGSVYQLPEFNLESIGSDKGFSQNSIFDIYQDSKGYIWFGTPNGLFRYDGYEFVVFRNLPDEREGLLYNEVLKVEEDMQGKIWILNRKALSVYNPATNLFRHYRLPDLGIQTFTSFKIDKHNSNNIWLGTQKNISLLTFDPQSGDVVSIKSPLINFKRDARIKQLSVSNIFQDARGDIWLSANRMFLKLSQIDGDYKARIISRDVFVDDFIQVSPDKYYMAANNRLHELYIKNDKTTSRKIIYSHPNKLSIDNLCIDPYGDVWAVIWGDGLLRIPMGGEQIYYPVFKSEKRMTRADFSSAMIDRSGVLWFGSFRGGLFKTNLYSKKFYSLDAYDNQHTLLTDNLVNQMSGDGKGHIWIGTYYGGLNSFHKDGRTLTSISSYQHTAESDPVIFPVLYHQGKIFYGGKGNAVYSSVVKEDGRMGKANALKLPLKQASFFYSDSLVIWTGSFIGGGIAYNKNGQFELLFDSKSKKPILEDISISALFRDDEGDMWIGTSNDGIYLAELDEDLSVKSLKSIKMPQEAQGADNNSIFTFHQDDTGRMWIGTFGGGIISLVKNSLKDKESFKFYRRADGLADDAVYAILEDEQGFLWISTDEGISKFDRDTEVFRNYNTADGFKNNTFRKWSSYQSKDGTLYFGGNMGLTFFKPNEIQDNPFLPQVDITRFKVEEEEAIHQAFVYHFDGKSDQQPYVLKPNQNSFSFEFAALHFQSPEKNEYEYMLEGIDEGWKKTNVARRYAGYSFIKAGDYCFKVRVSNGDGKWSTKAVAMNIKILPHWYETWWAKLLFVAAILASIVGWMQYQKRRHELQNALKMERVERENTMKLNQTKLNFFTNISHEIKTPLTIISGILEHKINTGQLIVEKRDFYVINKNTRRMLRLVSQLLDFRKINTGHMPLYWVKDNVVDFLNELYEPFEVYASKKNVELTFRSESKELAMVFDPDKLEKILSNLLSNALKHTPEGGAIAINVSKGLCAETPQWILKGLSGKSDDYITLKVTDTGAGISSDDLEHIFEQFYQSSPEKILTNTAEGVGIGLSFTKMLVELHKGNIFVTSELKKGSSFFVLLPLIQQGVDVDKYEGHEGLVSDVTERARQEYAPDDAFVLAPAEDINGEVIFYDQEILIVEDNDEIRKFVKEFLSPHYKIHEAKDGKEGLEKAISLMPDLIISDVMMPVMDGLEMCNQLKTQEKTNHIPIILLTANAHLEHRIEGLKCGADSYIPKPFNVEHLKVRIQKLLELRLTLKEKYVDLSGDMQLKDLDINAADKEFLSQLEELIEENLSNSEYTVVDIENALGYSRMQLYRKVKSISGISAIEFMRNHRLKRSVDMMHSTNLRINEILFSVGFSTPSYYSKCFKARYGKTPGDFLREIRNN
ncbi:response regulator [Labilibacter sediminis]|nr:response regulator [Labilibacter sediminis]